MAEWILIDDLRLNRIEHQTEALAGTPSNYTRNVIAFGVNRDIDLDMLSSASGIVSSIDLRHWAGNEDAKEAIRAARTAMDDALGVLYTQWWAVDRAANGEES